MTGAPYSLILLPTLACDADCDYCFEDKSEHRLTLDQLSIVVRKVMDHMEKNHFEALSIYWQGGEVMTLPPAWFEAANAIIGVMAQDRKLCVTHYLQSNMLAYTEKWNGVISEMFGNSVGTSMDYPNLHRRLKGGGPGEYERIWTRSLRIARDAGIEIGVIAIPNEKTLDLGAERFYSYFVDELGIRDFQVNTPFPGGAANAVKSEFPLQLDPLTRFLVDLADQWKDRGLAHGVRLGPFDKLLEAFTSGNRDLLCIWRHNCVNDFVCIDPRGHVAQCDCWVVGYPECRFGNLFESDTLSALLRESAARRSLQSRPGVLIQTEDCLECDYLGFCHGGCPVRAYTVHGSLFKKDPYCGLYKSLFQKLREVPASAPRAYNSSCTVY
jgi:radical SAM protein with 4Fe4S-binding SPASM domain